MLVWHGQSLCGNGHTRHTAFSTHAYGLPTPWRALFKSKSRRVKIQTALERSRRTLQDAIMLTLFFDLWRHRKVKQGQTVLIYSSQLFVT